MDESFEEAFYQIDSNHDGIITVDDLKHYVVQKNLKEVFIKKWLNLFADENEIIYYKSFCDTLGIVPKENHFNILKVDMSEKCRKHVLDKINHNHDKNADFLTDILDSEVSRDWLVMINPDDGYLEQPYANDGFIYLDSIKKDNYRILALRKLNELNYPILVLKCDMTKETKLSVMKIVENNSDKNLTEQQLDTIQEKLQYKYNDNWYVGNIPIKDACKLSNIHYKDDGLLCYCPNNDNTNALLIYRKSDNSNWKIIEADINEPMKRGLIKCVEANFDCSNADSPKAIDKESVLNSLNDLYGVSWSILINPSAKEAKVNYSLDGKLIIELVEDQVNGKIPHDKPLQLLIYRNDSGKRRGNLCCCGC